MAQNRATTSKPIVFGESFVCRRCGEVSTSRLQFGLSLGGVASSVVEYCEHCRPDTPMDALFDMAMTPRYGDV